MTQSEMDCQEVQFFGSRIKERNNTGGNALRHKKKQLVNLCASWEYGRHRQYAGVGAIIAPYGSHEHQ